MRLQTELVLEQVRLLPIKIAGTKEDSVVYLPFRVGLTRDMAETFGCRDLIFAGDVPRSGVDKFSLDGQEIDCEVQFRHDDIAFSATADSVSHFVVKMEGTGPVLCFQVKLTGYAVTVAELVDKVHIDPMEITLKPAQRDLGLVEEADKPETAVLVDGSSKTAFIDEDSGRLISVEQAADTAEENDGPALMPITLMGGSHQKGNKQKHGRRNPQPEPEPVIDGVTEDVPDFMKDLVPEVVQ